MNACTYQLCELCPFSAAFCNVTHGLFPQRRRRNNYSPLGTIFTRRTLHGPGRRMRRLIHRWDVLCLSGTALGWNGRGEHGCLRSVCRGTTRSRAVRLQAFTLSALRSENGISAPSSLVLVSNNSEWGDERDPMASTVVVVAAHDEDVSWLRHQPFQSVVMTKGGRGSGEHHLAENKGNEISSYLQFILLHYDSLPPRMVFVHGHNESWHLAVRPTRFLMQSTVIGVNLMPPVRRRTSRRCSTRSIPLPTSLRAFPTCSCSSPTLFSFQGGKI